MSSASWEEAALEIAAQQAAAAPSGLGPLDTAEEAGAATSIQLIQTHIIEWAHGLATAADTIDKIKVSTDKRTHSHALDSEALSPATTKKPRTLQAAPTDASLPDK